MVLNPEFRRNLWLELTLQRLIVMPLVLCSSFLLIYLVSGKRMDNTVSNFALVFFGALTFLWGTRLSSESVISEIRDRTWDGQRTSAISPWQMTWGKLFGSTLYTWYGGIICLFFYGLSGSRTFLETLQIILLFVLCGVFSQTIGFLASLQALGKDRKYNRSQASAFMIAGVVVAWPVFSFALQGNFYVEWYGIEIHNMTMAIASLALFLGWALTGCFRIMRVELQMKNSSWIWFLFILFLSAYLAGFINPGDQKEMGLFSARLLLAFLVAIFSTYAMVLSEKKDPIKFHRLQFALEKKDMAYLFGNLDCWMVSLFLAVFFMALLFFAGEASLFMADGIHFKSTLLTALLFLVRDIMLLLYLNFSKNAKRADMATVIYLAVLYGLAPSILNAMGMHNLTVFFWPGSGDYAAYAPPLVALEAALIFFLFRKRYSGYFKIN